jgi:hypothetical protein
VSFECPRLIAALPLYFAEKLSFYGLLSVFHRGFAAVLYLIREYFVLSAIRTRRLMYISFSPRVWAAVENKK